MSGVEFLARLKDKFGDTIVAADLEAVDPWIGVSPEGLVGLCQYLKSESDLAGLGRLAVAGRLRTLLVEGGRVVSGTLDQTTGAVEIHQGDDSPTAGDVLDDLTDLTIRHGGDVLVLSADEMPVETGAAGVLR